MKLVTAIFALAVLDIKTAVLAEDTYYFLVSQVRQSQDWCIIAPHLSRPYGPTYDESKLGFGHCDPDWDGYYQPWQLFRLADDGKMHSGEYDDLCMIVHNGVNIGGGLMRLDDCTIDSDLNKFTYDQGTKNIRLAPPNEDYCVTNEGNSPNLDDAVHAKACGTGGRYEFEFQEARYYWQILPDSCEGGPACMMSEDGRVPTAGDHVILDHCDSHGDAWRFEDTSTDAVLFHSKLDDGMCMQAGHGGVPPHDGMKMRFYPCDSGNYLQRFVRDLDSGYMYQITLEDRNDLCVVRQGTTCEVGRDEIVLKYCSAAVGRDTWYDDEG